MPLAEDISLPVPNEFAELTEGVEVTGSENEIEIEQLLHLIKEDLLQCIEDGVAEYKKLMDDLLETKQPLKDSQLLDYHKKNSSIIKDALRVSYQQLLVATEGNTILENQMLQLLTTAKEKLEMQVNIQFKDIYLRKLDIQMDSAVKVIQGFTSQAELLYDEKAETMEPTNEENIKAKHTQWADEAMRQFDQRLSDNHIDSKIQDFWRCDLQFKLNDRLEYLIEEYKENEPLIQQPQIATKIKPPQSSSPYRTYSSTYNTSQPKSMQFVPPLPIGQPHERKPLRRVENSGNVYRLIDKESGEDTVNEPKPLAAPSTPVQIAVPRSSTLDLGCYFDRNSFIIGHSRGPQNYEEIIKLSPEIYFSTEDVLIGEEAAAYHRSVAGTYFNIFELVSPTTLPKFPMSLEIKGQNGNVTNFTMCPHEIIAKFFQKVLKSIEIDHQIKIGRIIFTIPFEPTSSAKDSIRKAAKIAGYDNVRVLSSVLTMAISTLKNSGYYNEITTTKAPKYLFALDAQKDSFSMGIVEITPVSICVINPYGSENMNDCEKELFIQTHGNLYESKTKNGHIPPFGLQRVQRIYEKAMDYVFGGLKDLEVADLQMVLREDFSQSALVTDVVVGLFNKKVNYVDRSSEHGSPLLGASILASSLNSSTGLLAVLPPGIHVHDASRSTLLFSSRRKNHVQNYEIKWFKNILFVNRCVFHFHVSLVIRNRDFIVLHLNEYFRSDQATFRVARFRLSLNCTDDSNCKVTSSTGKKKVKVGIRCLVDHDGIVTFELDRDFKFPQGVEVRLENNDCACNH